MGIQSVHFLFMGIRDELMERRLWNDLIRRTMDGIKQPSQMNERNFQFLLFGYNTFFKFWKENEFFMDEIISFKMGMNTFVNGMEAIIWGNNPLITCSTKKSYDFLKVLEFHDEFNDTIDSIQYLTHLKKLTFGERYNKSIDALHNLPLTHLKFGWHYNQPIDSLRNNNTLI